MQIGILGGGQLGRMLSMAALPLAIRTKVFDPNRNCCASDVSEHLLADYDQYDQLEQFARGLPAITYEFENIPLDAVRFLEERTCVFPGGKILEVSQDRLLEKNFVNKLGISVADFVEFDSSQPLSEVQKKLGDRFIIKTRRFGYDGKGQWFITPETNADEIAFPNQPMIAEAFVPFDRELSIIGVRSQTGEFCSYPLVQNVHKQGILRHTTAPAPDVDEQLKKQAIEIAHAIMNETNYVGVLAVELFQVGNKLLVNEMAPRVHNSGHWSILGAETSQFENHMRAVAGLPLGSTKVNQPCGMVNLIGHIPSKEQLCQLPNTAVHLYNKESHSGRKVGHLHVFGENHEQVAERIAETQKQFEV